MNKFAVVLTLGLTALTMFYPQAANLVQNVQNSEVSASEIPAWIVQNFQNWKMRHNRAYESVEMEIYRMGVFYENYIFVQMENARQNDYVLAENEFMDMTREEWAAKYLTTFPEGYEYPTNTDTEEYNAVNGQVNWISAGKVGPVLNQGQCGSCWAFSATETVQSAYAVYKNQLPSLSEQQLVDCSGPYGNQGCNGGWPSQAMAYTRDKGQTTSSAYPYTGRQGTCRVQGGTYKIAAVRTSAGCATLQSNLNAAPTSVCVDASNWSFYKSGVFSNCAANINHAVLAVGYDASGNWIVQNSWGTTWGTNGLIYLRSGNTCGVCNVLANASF